MEDFHALLNKSLLDDYQEQEMRNHNQTHRYIKDRDKDYDDIDEDHDKVLARYQACKSYSRQAARVRSTSNI